MNPDVNLLIPMAFVADVECSVAFYHKLGFLRRHTHKNPQGTTVWVGMGFEGNSHGSIMLSLASEPVDAKVQAVLFYLYSDDLAALRKRLISDGIDASEIRRPFYMPAGEMRVTDPDGYCLLIGQLA